MASDLPPPHEARTPSGITLPDPDQGTPYVQVSLVFPTTDLRVWEPFEDGSEGGHNLYGFLERWQAWTASEAPWLHCREPRFGWPIAIPRSIIPHVTQFSIQYWRKDDVRAGVRSPLAVPGQPSMRRLADGSIEVQVPVPRR